MNQQEVVEINCPYCGESLSVLIDCSMPAQDYIEDCQVCCRPMNLLVLVGAAGVPRVEVRREDE